MILILFLCFVLLQITPVYAQSIKNPEGQGGDVEMAARLEKGYAGIYVVRPSDMYLFEKFYVYVDKIAGPNRMGYTKGWQS